MINLTGYPINWLPAGSVLEVQAQVGPFTVPHPGILAYVYGQPVMLHKSKKIGKSAISSISEFADGKTPCIRFVPSSQDEGARIVQSAAGEVSRGAPWTVGDNCQDFVSRAITGQDGSPSRNGLVLGCVLGALFVFAALK
jgi:hypothetical protein